MKLDYTVDPELVDDRDSEETDIEFFSLPDFDMSQFELDEKFEFVDAPLSREASSSARVSGLPEHLRRWGLTVEETDGWQQRGRPYSFYPKAIIVHHTASPSSGGNFASERIVTVGRTDLPGPLCQFLLGRNGVVRIISAGYANHAGYGGPRAGIPKNMGNTFSYGIEAENNGVGETWPDMQLNAYYRLCAALLDWMGTKDVSKVIGHKEWTSRKIDPAGVSMSNFRDNVKKALNAGNSVTEISLSKLQPCKKNSDVLLLKKALQKRGIFDGAMDNVFGVGLLKSYQRWQLSLGYTGTDADGLPGKESLQRLGFKVIA